MFSAAGVLSSCSPSWGVKPVIWLSSRPVKVSASASALSRCPAVLAAGAVAG